MFRLRKAQFHQFPIALMEINVAADTKEKILKLNFYFLFTQVLLYLIVSVDRSSFLLRSF